MTSPQEFYAQGGEALARNDYPTAASLFEQACMAVLRPSATVSDMQQEARTAREAAEGDSNDDEIQALQEALRTALTRWPEVKQA